MRVRSSGVFFVAVLILTAALVAQLPVVSGESRVAAGTDDLLRLHIIANSDAERDQAMKGLVRDTIVDLASKELGLTADSAATRQYFVQNADRLRELAEATLRENGNYDTVKVDIGQHWFPEKSYKGAVVPAGTYESVRIIIGDGRGHNWWCVVFPPLCFSVEGGEAATAEVVVPDTALVDEEQLQPVHYEIRFKTIEVLKRMSRVPFCSIREDCGAPAVARADTPTPPHTATSTLHNIGR